MSPPCQQHDHPERRERPRAAPVQRVQIVVIGLGAVGRQVALQVAALSPGSLQLVDPRIVSARTQQHDGFAADDIGRPRSTAVAQACHALNPRLEVYASRRLPTPAPPDAIVLVCDVSGAERSRLRRRFAGRVRWFVDCRVPREAIVIQAIPDARATASPAHPRRVPGAAQLQRHRQLAALGALGAGLLTLALHCGANGPPKRQTLRLDLRPPRLTIRRHARR